MADLVSRIKKGVKIARDDVAKPVVNAAKYVFSKEHRSRVDASNKKQAMQKAKEDWEVFRDVEDPEPKNPMSAYKQARSNYYTYYKD